MDGFTADILRVLQRDELRQALLDRAQRRAAAIVRLGQLDTKSQMLRLDEKTSEAAKVDQQIKRCEQQLGMQ